MVIDQIELLALKKIAVICGALADTFTASTAREQRALTSVLIEVINRAELDNARAKATEPRP
jgi:hypothetical protein